mmetsp:Transcript_33268/g.102736  ORF Transcript_33268/g.102736 Transcript_33268/m.102736 type:complete len:252 (-) Transcript_33268:256-1011(-)
MTGTTSRSLDLARCAFAPEWELCRPRETFRVLTQRVSGIGIDDFDGIGCGRAEAQRDKQRSLAHREGLGESEDVWRAKGHHGEVSHHLEPVGHVLRDVTGDEDNLLVLLPGLFPFLVHGSECGRERPALAQHVSAEVHPHLTDTLRAEVSDARRPGDGVVAAQRHTISHHFVRPLGDRNPRRVHALRVHCHVLHGVGLAHLPRRRVDNDDGWKVLHLVLLPQGRSQLAGGRQRGPRLLLTVLVEVVFVAVH